MAKRKNTPLRAATGAKRTRAPAAAEAKAEDDAWKVDNAPTIRSFLASVRPLSGCCHCGDDDFHRGRALIERMALAAEGEMSLRLSHADCADVLRFIHGIEPIEPKFFFVDRDGVTTPQCGLNVVLQTIEQYLREGPRV